MTEAEEQTLCKLMSDASVTLRAKTAAMEALQDAFMAMHLTSIAYHKDSEALLHYLMAHVRGDKLALKFTGNALV